MKSLKNWPDNLATAEEAENWIESVMEDVSYNPDFPASEYIDRDGNPSFTEDQCIHMDRLTSQAIEILSKDNVDGVYKVCVKLSKKIWGDD